MDEWHVGDPPDWGDSVGVPDIPYMGYINDGEDEEDGRPERGSHSEPRDEVLAGEAFDLQEEERYDEALTLINRALEINPNKSNHWNVKAIILDNSGSHEEALEYYDRSLDMKNSDVVMQNKAQCLYRIARLKNVTCDFDEGLEYINRALAIVLNDDERINYLFLKGRILDSLGRQVQAKKCFLLASGCIDEIKELEEKEKMIKNSKDTLINITGTKFYKGSSPFKPGTVVDLVKEPQNGHDRNAIRVEINHETVGYVGNSSRTVPDGVKSATQISDKFTNTAKAEVMFFYLNGYVIAKLI